MARLLLPLLASLLLAAPAHAEALGATKDDPAERPDDPGRDIQSIGSTFDPAAATWTVAVRFYGVPTAETRALLRVVLGERLDDGSCRTANFPVQLSAWSNPEDRGGTASMEAQSQNVVKAVDEDRKGFSLSFTDQRLSGRAVCGIASTTLSYKQPFDSVPGFEFPGAPTEPAPAPPADPAGDTTPPSAYLKLLRDSKSLNRGIVRVSILAATEPASVRTTLYGPAGAITRQTRTIAPGQELRLALRLTARTTKRLRRTGRLPVRVATVLTDAAGNAATLRASGVLRHKRRG